MATISSQLKMTDSVSGVLQKITSNINTCITSFDRMESVSSQAMNVGTIDIANIELSKMDSIVDDITGSLFRMEQQQQDIIHLFREGNSVTDRMAANINNAEKSQYSFNRSLRNGQSASSGMLDNIMQMAGYYLSIQGVEKVLNLSDQAAMAPARLSFIVDDGGSVDALQNDLFDMANRTRSPVQDIVDQVSQLGLLAGSAFDGNDELLAFTELMNKSFAIGSTNIESQAAAMRQLTQGLASGRLQGDEYVSVMEGATFYYNKLEEYMRSIGFDEPMKELAAQGLFTSEVLVAAMFYASQDIENMFADLPKTWSDLWEMTSNNVLMSFQPLLEGIGQVPQSIIDNWGNISQILTGVSVAIGGVAFAMGIWKSAAMLSAVATNIMALSQMNLNAAFMVSPISWIVGGVLLLIGVIYGAVAAYNHFTGSTVNGTGIIVGSLAVLGAAVANLFMAAYNILVDVAVAIWNTLIDLGNFVANFLIDPLGSSARLIMGFADTAIGLIQSVMEAIDLLTGKHLADSIQGFRNDMANWTKDMFGEQTLTIAERINADNLKFQSGFDPNEAWNTGYAAGEGLEGMIGDLFTVTDIRGYDPSSYDYNSSPYEPPELLEIADNTGSTANSLKDMSGELTFMRDIADREAVNRFITAEVKFDMTGMSNNISSDLDLDGIFNTFAVGLAEQADAGLEGALTW